MKSRPGGDLPRPKPKESEPAKDLSAYLQQVRAVSERLTASLSKDENEWTAEQRACWLLAQLLEWHRREEKSAWWEYFRLCELSDDQLLEDRSAMGGLVYEGEVGQIKKSLVHRYRFPLQDHSIDRARNIHDPKTRDSAGTLVAINERELTIDLKRGIGSKTPHPRALIPNDIFNTNEMRESLLRLGTWVADNGIGGAGAYQAARDLLLRQSPRLKGCVITDFSGLELVEAAKLI